MRGRAAASLLALLALAAAAPLPAPRTNSTTGLRPGCVPGWKFAPRRYDWPAGGAPGHAGHWSSRCGYRHTTLHRCGAPLPSAYDCADAGVWTQAPPASVDGVPAGPAATTVSLTYGGQLGNNMFQYAFAYRLAVEIAACQAAISPRSPLHLPCISPTSRGKSLRAEVAADSRTRGLGRRRRACRPG